MSGGKYDYQQYHIGNIREQMYGDIVLYSDCYQADTVAKFIEIHNHLVMAEIEVQRMDWLFSADDGEESFHERLAEETRDIESSLLSVSRLRRSQVDLYNNLIKQLKHVLYIAGEQIEDKMRWKFPYSKHKWIEEDVRKARKAVDIAFADKEINLLELKGLVATLANGTSYAYDD
jgi:hypothetical protein